MLVETSNIRRSLVRKTGDNLGLWLVSFKERMCRGPLFGTEPSVCGVWYCLQVDSVSPELDSRTPSWCPERLFVVWEEPSYLHTDRIWWPELWYPVHFHLSSSPLGQILKLVCKSRKKWLLLLLGTFGFGFGVWLFWRLLCVYLITLEFLDAWVHLLFINSMIYYVNKHCSIPLSYMGTMICWQNTIFEIIMLCT